MTDFWVDANVLLRFLTGEPPELAERALRLIQRAEQGEVRDLRVNNIPSSRVSTPLNPQPSRVERSRNSV
jgi:hypothetical protein